MTQLEPATASSPANPTTPAPDPAEQPRVYLLVRELTHDETFTFLVATWVESKAQGRMLSVPFVNRLADQRLLQSAVSRLMDAIDQLPPEAQALAISLVASGAFTRRELREPTRITAYFARADWPEIVAAWRKSPLPEIGQVIQGIEAERRRQAKQTAPPPVSIGNGRGTNDHLAGRLKALLPRSLRTWATDFAEGLRAVAADPCVAWDAEAIAAAVKRRRVGTGTRVCHRAIASGLPFLVEHGFVIVEGDKVRIQPGALI